MGATCGVLSRNNSRNIHIIKLQISPKIKASRHVKFESRVNLHNKGVKDAKDARLGVYYMEDVMDVRSLSKSKALQSKKRIIKWNKMANYHVNKISNSQYSNTQCSSLKSSVAGNGSNAPSSMSIDSIDVTVDMSNAELGLENFIKDNHKKFERRLCKGPPPQYRWLAWKVATKMKKLVIPGLYEEELLGSTSSNEWMHSIKKDLNRSVPDHVFFNEDKYGEFGQKLLSNVLRAYSLYNIKVGYCQGMNFIIAFILLINGGNDEEAFWMFCALTKTNFNHSPKFDGIEGLFQEGFPLLDQLVFQFDEIFKEKLPELYNHFSNQGFVNGLWLHKWFLSLFLLSFPNNLCIRIWDNLIVQGMSYMFKVALVVLKHFEKELLTQTMDELNEYFKSFKNKNTGQGILPDPETIIHKANKIKISEKYLTELKDKHAKSKAKTAQVISFPARNALRDNLSFTQVKQQQNKAIDDDVHDEEEERKIAGGKFREMKSLDSFQEISLDKKESTFTDVTQKFDGCEEDSNIGTDSKLLMHKRSSFLDYYGNTSFELDERSVKEELKLPLTNDNKIFYEKREFGSPIAALITNRNPAFKNFSSRDSSFSKTSDSFRQPNVGCALEKASYSSVSSNRPHSFISAAGYTTAANSKSITKAQREDFNTRYKNISGNTTPRQLQQQNSSASFHNPLFHADSTDVYWDNQIKEIMDDERSCTSKSNSSSGSIKNKFKIEDMDESIGERGGVYSSRWVINEPEPGIRLGKSMMPKSSSSGNLRSEDSSTHTTIRFAHKLPI